MKRQIPDLVNISNERFMFLTFVFFLLFGCVREASAQLCPGSHVYLTVRDENGKIVDPTPLNTHRRLTRTFDFVRVKAIELPAAYSSETSSAKALVFSNEGCTFRALEETTFELQGKTMRLVFRNARRIKDRSSFYTIDLPPLRQGAFEIDLSSPTGLLSDPAELISPDEDLPYLKSRDYG